MDDRHTHTPQDMELEAQPQGTTVDLSVKRREGEPPALPSQLSSEADSSAGTAGTGPVGCSSGTGLVGSSSGTGLVGSSSGTGLVGSSSGTGLVGSSSGTRLVGSSSGTGLVGSSSGTGPVGSSSGTGPKAEESAAAVARDTPELSTNNEDRNDVEVEAKKEVQ